MAIVHLEMDDFFGCRLNMESIQQSQLLHTSVIICEIFSAMSIAKNLRFLTFKQFFDSEMSLHKVRPNFVRVWRFVSKNIFNVILYQRDMFEIAVITATYQTYSRCLLGLAQLKTRESLVV